MIAGVRFLLLVQPLLLLERPVKAPVIVPAPQHVKQGGPAQNQNLQPVAQCHRKAAGDYQAKQYRQNHPAAVEEHPPEGKFFPVGGADQIILYMDVPGLSLSPVEGGLTGEKIGQALPGNGEIDPAGEQKREPYGDMAAEKQTQSSPEHQ